MHRIESSRPEAHSRTLSAHIKVLQEASSHREGLAASKGADGAIGPGLIEQQGRGVGAAEALREGGGHVGVHEAGGNALRQQAQGEDCC